MKKYSPEGNIKINGETEGDHSVGIGGSKFEIDTGLEELSEEDRKFLADGIIRDMWDLHDNGKLIFWFSDDPDTFGIMDWQRSRDILNKQKGVAIGEWRQQNNNKLGQKI